MGARGRDGMSCHWRACIKVLGKNFWAVCMPFLQGTKYLLSFASRMELWEVMWSGSGLQWRGGAGAPGAPHCLFSPWLPTPRPCSPLPSFVMSQDVMNQTIYTWRLTSSCGKVTFPPANNHARIWALNFLRKINQLEKKDHPPHLHL